MPIPAYSAGQFPTAASLNTALNSPFALGIDAWTGYTPTLTQSATITKTVTRAAYTRVGRTIRVQIFLTATSSGTAANNLIVGLPVAPAADNQLGVGLIYDTSASTRYVCTVQTFGSTLAFQHDTSGASNFGVAPAVTIATGDQIGAFIEYEAAS